MEELERAVRERRLVVPAGQSTGAAAPGRGVRAAPSRGRLMSEGTFLPLARERW